MKNFPFPVNPLPRWEQTVLILYSLCPLAANQSETT